MNIDRETVKKVIRVLCLESIKKEWTAEKYMKRSTTISGHSSTNTLRTLKSRTIM